jgi:hypothetical protein
MEAAAQKRVSSHSIVMGDMRHRQEMEQSNRDFIAALDRYFHARDLWGK